MKRKADMGMAVLILFAFFAVYLLGRPEPDPGTGDQLQTKEGVSLETQVSEHGIEIPPGVDQPRGRHTKDSPMRRDTLAPGSTVESIEDDWRIQFADVMSLKADQLPDFVRKKLDAALQGDLEAALMVHEARSKCWTVPGSEKALEQRVANMNRRAKNVLKKEGAIESPTGSSPNQLFETEAENRAHQLRWFLACQQMRQVYENDYRAKILDRAQEGDVVARYLYAIWPPPDGLPLHDFLNWQQWQSLAQQFSMKNLEEGEVAGVLAYAQANSSIDSFLPTRNINNRRSLAFYIAARDCGFQSTRIGSLIDTLVIASVPPMEEHSEEMAEILSLAEEIKTLCH